MVASGATSRLAYSSSSANPDAIRKSQVSSRSGILGTNTLEVYDVAGNVTTLTFTLAAK